MLFWTEDQHGNMAFDIGYAYGNVCRVCVCVCEYVCITSPGVGAQTSISLRHLWTFQNVMAFCYPGPSWTHFEGCLCSRCCMLITFSGEHVHDSHANPHFLKCIHLIFLIYVFFPPPTDRSRNLDAEPAVKALTKCRQHAMQQESFLQVGITK